MPKTMWGGEEVKWRGLDTVPYRDGILSQMVPRPGSRDGSNTFERAVIEDSWEEPRNLREYLSKPIDRGVKNWPSVLLFYTRVSCAGWASLSIFWVPFEDWMYALSALPCSFLGSLLFRYFMDPVRSEWLFGSYGAYWEEATTIFEKSQVMRASMPFIELGDDLMVVLIYLGFIQLRTSYKDWSYDELYPYMFFLAVVCCTFLRDVMWTHDQYARKRNIRLGGEAEYEQIVRESALHLWEASEPALPGCSVSYSADLRWERSVMLRKGFQAEIEFIFKALQEVLRGDGGQPNERLFERWHKLHAAQVVQQDLMHLTRDDGMSLISARQRQTLQKVKAHCSTEMGKLRILVAELTHGDSDASIVRALLEHQHTQQNDSVAERAQQNEPPSFAERSNKRITRQKATRRSIAQNRSASATLQPCVTHVGKACTPKQCQTRSLGEGCNNVHSSRRAASGSDCGSHGIDAKKNPSSLESPELSSNTGADANAIEPPEAEQKTDCVCCFDEEAAYVFERCGHLIYCEACLKWAEVESGRGKLISRISLKCPLCRSESRVVHLNRFEGKVYS